MDSLGEYLYARPFGLVDKLPKLGPSLVAQYTNTRSNLNIELFNLSLLARQAWRVMIHPTTLSSRIQRTVYFP